MDDEPAIIESTLTEAFRQAPPYIQNYIRGGQFEAFMGRLGSHFGLHADTLGAVSNEILMTIMGLTPPTELADNLKNEAGVAEGLINPILEELNTEVFVPLRESLQNQEPAAEPAVAAPQPPKEEWIQVSPTPQPSIGINQIPSQPSVPVQPIAPPVVPTPVTPAPEVAPIVPPVPPPVTTPTPVVPVMPTVPAPAPIPVPPPQTYQAARPSVVASTPPEVPEYREMMSMMRTMSKDIESLKGGTQPSMTPWKPISVPVTGSVSRAPSYISPVVHPEVSPTPVASSVSIPQSTPVTPVETAPHTQEQIVVPKRGGSAGDPYREPVE